MSERLTPERAVRLLRAKAGELESWVLQSAELTPVNPLNIEQIAIHLAADIALVAGLLADHIEQSPGPWGPEDEGSINPLGVDLPGG